MSKYRHIALAGLFVVSTVLSIFVNVPQAGATIPNRQTWVHQPGTCPPALEGAVFGLAGDNCGGTGTTFDTTQIYGHTLIRDTASPAAPCEAGRTTRLCYRMWYQGIDSDNRFFIGYALSPDGITWTRVPGSGTNGSVIGEGPTGTFDERNTAVATIVKDGLLYRMWYNAQDGSEVHRIGHVVSLNGLTWVRPVPNDPVWQGSDDPGTLVSDNVWSPFVLKEGLSYRMWYNPTTRENSRRVGLAQVTPGTPLSAVGLSGVDTVYTVTFNGAGNTGWSLELTNNRVVWWVLSTNGQWVSVSHPTTLTANTCHHLALTYDAATGTACLFVDGTPGIASTVGAITVGPDFVLGYSFIVGQIDELRISNTIRYTASFTVDSATAALVSFNEGSGQTTTDRTGANLTLDITSNPDAADPLWMASDALTL